MKRKIFSKLLMVALVIAAVGSFVSCKDYDDDINNLQKQIDAKAALSELTALQSTLDSKIAAAQTAAQAAQAKADAAATKTSVDEMKKALETAIADAKKAGTDAGTQAGEAIKKANEAATAAEEAAAAAKKADEDAKDALAKALETIAETYQTKAEAAEAAAEAADALAAVKEIAEAAYTKAAAEELQKEVDDLKTSLEGLQESLEADIDKKIDEKIKEVNNAVASVDAIWSAVTSVELYKSLSDNGGVQKAFPLLLFRGTEITNTFGADTDAKKEYEAGKEIEFNNELIVRVQPTNATLTKEQIQLINSKGESLIDKGIVKVTDVQPYTQLITRSGYQTGLWKVTVIREAEVEDATIQKAVAGKATAGEGMALYALSVADKDKEDRSVNSTFDITVWYGPYVPSVAIDFTVNTIEVKEIHNRWDAANGAIAEDKTIIRDKDRKPMKEYRWADCLKEKGYYIADYARIYMDANKETSAPVVDTLSTSDFKAANYVADATDYRYGKALLPVALGEEIIISNVNTNKIVNKYGKTELGRVQWYYVTLDEAFAAESKPSELNIWKEYESQIDGLNKMTSANDKLYITVNDPRAVGDVIGFRLYAVNYDGTLADPDGKAFYVRIGQAEEEEIETIPAVASSIDVNLYKAGTAEIAISNAKELFEDGDYMELVATDLADEPWMYANAAATTPLGYNAATKEVEGETTATLPFAVEMASATATKVKVTYDPATLLNNATYTQTYAVKQYTDLNKDKNKAETLRYVTFSIKKVLPANITPEGLTWAFKDNVGDNGVLKLFVNKGAAAQAGWTYYVEKAKTLTAVNWETADVTINLGNLLSKATVDSLANPATGGHTAYGLNVGLYIKGIDLVADTIKAADVAAGSYAKGAPVVYQNLTFGSDYATKWQGEGTETKNYAGAANVNHTYNGAFGGLTDKTAVNDARTYFNAPADITVTLPSLKLADGTTRHELMYSIAQYQISRKADDTGMKQASAKAATLYPTSGNTGTGLYFVFDTWSNALAISGLQSTYTYKDATAKVQSAAAKIEVEEGQDWKGYTIPTGCTSNGGDEKVTSAKILVSNTGYPIIGATKPLTLDQVLDAAAADGKFEVADVNVYKDQAGTERSQYYRIGGSWATLANVADNTKNMQLVYLGTAPALTAASVTEYVVIKLVDNLGAGVDFQLANWNWNKSVWGALTTDVYDNTNATWSTGASDFSAAWPNWGVTKSVAFPITIKRAGSSARAK